MVLRKDVKTLRISTETKDDFDSLGKKNETSDELLKRIITAAKPNL